MISMDRSSRIRARKSTDRAMRFRSHLLASALTGLALYPRSPRRALALVLAGTLIDVDHLALYVLQTGDWSLSGALHYDRYRHRPGGEGDNRPRYGSLRSPLHEPLLLLPLIWGLASEQAALRPVAYGLSLHLLLDYIEWPRFYLAFLRSGRRCEECGSNRRKLTVYRWREDNRPTYHTLCRPCYARRYRIPRVAPLTVVH